MRKYHQEAKTSTDEIHLKFSHEELKRLLTSELHTVALELGTRVLSEMLEDHVRQICGPRNGRGNRATHRYGKQNGYIMVSGQKVRIARPRVRTADNTREIELSLYRQLQERDVFTEGVMRRLTRGVSCRNYMSIIDTVRASAGVSRSSVSRSFIEATERKLREFQLRRFDGTRFVAIFIDGVCFQRSMLVAAIGVAADGTKVVLAMREGATENAQVCVDLLEELRERGVPTDVPTLFVLDGAKALRAAVVRVWGDCALIQRCRVHKLRNVQSYLAEEFWPTAATRIRTAYAEPNFAKARRSLLATARWLDRICPPAAASLREGLDETLTVARLKLPLKLRRALMSTNVIENAFSRVRTICGRVKRWRPSMRTRWCAAALLETERTFHRFRGSESLASLVKALDSTLSRAKVA